MDIFAANKKWVAIAKATHFFSAKNANAFVIFQDRNSNVKLADNFVLNNWAYDAKRTCLDLREVCLGVKGSEY